MALDFFAGCVGGCAGLLVGHPFDTIKVRLQTDSVKKPRYKSATHCFVTTIKTESFMGLYKGISSPMVGIAFINAILFGTYGSIQRQFEDQDSLTTFFLAGGLAGMIQAFIASPMELVKTRIQIQGQGTSSYSSLIGKKPVSAYKGPVDCVQKLYASEGLRGVFRGQCVTLLREFTGIGLYFSSYEYLTQHFLTDPNEKNSMLSTGELLLAGGLAGVISWVPTYPIDMVKSRLQVDGCEGPRMYKGAIHCAIKSYKEEGGKAFTRGMAPTILRAFPTNAATFTVVAWIMRLSGYVVPAEMDDKKEALVPDVTSPEIKLKPTKETREPGFLASLKGIGAITITKEMGRLAMYAQPCESKFLKDIQLVSQFTFLSEKLEKKYADKMVPIAVPSKNTDAIIIEGKLLNQDVTAEPNDTTTTTTTTTTATTTTTPTLNDNLSTRTSSTMRRLSVADMFYVDLSRQDCELSAATTHPWDKSELLASRSTELLFKQEVAPSPALSLKDTSSKEMVQNKSSPEAVPISCSHSPTLDNNMDMSAEDLPSTVKQSQSSDQVPSDQRSNTLLEACRQKANCDTRSQEHEEEDATASTRAPIRLNEGIFIGNDKSSETFNARDTSIPKIQVAAIENNSCNLEDSEVAPCSPTCNNNTRCCTYSMDFIEQESRIVSAFSHRIFGGMVRHLKTGLADLSAGYDIN